LLDDSFASLPKAVREGQRVRNGMTDILKLFLTRVLSMALLLIGTGIVGEFPLGPKHNALLTLLTVGIPSIALAAWARPGPALRPSALRQMLHFVLPAALTLTIVELGVHLAAYLMVDSVLTPTLGDSAAEIQAIATARRLGAVVEAFDTRPVVKEQVQSLGAKFLEIELGEQGEGTGGYAKELSEEAHRKEQELVGTHVKDADVVITTALVPGRRAPILVTADMVRGMRPGSVIVDLAAEMGGNCELTSPGETVVRERVTIHGEVNLPSTVAFHASQLYARNVSALIGLLVKDGALAIDLEDEIIKGALITHQGEVVHAATKAALEKA
jgi:hypothetical protein